MSSVLAPFIVAAVAAILYFWLGARGENAAGKAMRSDVNFYLAGIVVTAIVSIIGNLELDKNWIDTATWIIAAIAIAAFIFRFKTASKTSQPTTTKEAGPLERASKK